MSSTADGRGDFDFFLGRWRVSHRRLRRRLVGDATWEEFGGECRCMPLLEGLGNVDENWLDLPTGAYRAVSLRFFQPASRLWSIWWIDSRSMRLEPPVHGRFEQGTGTFIGDDWHAGHPVRVRFHWTGTDTGSPRWEQAFSIDGGTNWETNWVMRFEPMAPEGAPWP